MTKSRHLFFPSRSHLSSLGHHCLPTHLQLSSRRYHLLSILCPLYYYRQTVPHFDYINHPLQAKTLVMAETAGASGGSKYYYSSTRKGNQLDLAATHIENIAKLRRQYRCPHFRILVIGRANAGKTTILEKVCGVRHGTMPIICDKEGKLNKSPMYFLIFHSF